MHPVMHKMLAGVCSTGKAQIAVTFTKQYPVLGL